MAKDLNSTRKASFMLNIPEKNIKRWIKNGPERKKGAGRKTTDPEMEKQLIDWITKIFTETGQLIDLKALK